MLPGKLLSKTPTQMGIGTDGGVVSVSVGVETKVGKKPGM